MIQQLNIETPENISFNYDVAGIGSRFIALLLDTLIQLVIFIALLFALTYLQSLGSFIRNLYISENWLIAIFFFITFLIFTLYFVVFEVAASGQTPGKRLMRLRVVKENGYPLSALDVIIRNLVRLIDFFPGAYSIGAVVMLCNSRAKRLGDFAAGTLVIKQRDVSQFKLPHVSMARSEANEPSAETLVWAEAVKRLTESDVQMIENLLSRRHELENYVSQSLAEKVANAVSTRMQWPEIDTVTKNAARMNVDAFAFLQRVMYERRGRVAP